MLSLSSIETYLPFQVVKRDHAAAGLCCIQLFMNSSTQEEAIGHLENAKVSYFYLIIKVTVAMPKSHLVVR